jgi:hypothetical protein
VSLRLSVRIGFVLANAVTDAEAGRSRAAIGVGAVGRRNDSCEFKRLYLRMNIGFVLQKDPN